MSIPQVFCTFGTVFAEIMEKDETIQLGLKKIEIDISRFNQEPDYNSLYILPTRNLVLFPGLTVTFELGRSSSLALARRAERDKLPIGIVLSLIHI